MPAMTGFFWNEAVYRALISGPNGHVARDLQRRAVRVETQAKRNASGRPGPNVRTGRLRGSITHTLGQDAKSMYADVGSNVHYAIFVELGTSRAPAYPYLVPSLSAARTNQ